MSQAEIWLDHVSNLSVVKYVFAQFLRQFSKDFTFFREEVQYKIAQDE